MASVAAAHLGLEDPISGWFTLMLTSWCWLLAVTMGQDCGPWSLWASPGLLGLPHTMMSGFQEAESHGGSVWHHYTLSLEVRVSFSLNSVGPSDHKDPSGFKMKECTLQLLIGEWHICRTSGGKILLQPSGIWCQVHVQTYEQPRWMLGIHTALSLPRS